MNEKEYHVIGKYFKTFDTMEPPVEFSEVFKMELPDSNRYNEVKIDSIIIKEIVKKFGCNEKCCGWDFYNELG